MKATKETKTIDIYHGLVRILGFHSENERTDIEFDPSGRLGHDYIYDYRQGYKSPI